MSAGLSAFGAFPVVGEVADTAKIAKKVLQRTEDLLKMVKLQVNQIHDKRRYANV